jgi:hypothetical protein
MMIWRFTWPTTAAPYAYLALYSVLDEAIHRLDAHKITLPRMPGCSELCGANREVKVLDHSVGRRQLEEFIPLFTEKARRRC